MQDRLPSASLALVEFAAFSRENRHLLRGVASVSRLESGSLTFVTRLQTVCQKFEDSRMGFTGKVVLALADSKSVTFYSP